MTLKQHPDFNILVSSDGSIVRNLDTGYDYSFHITSNGYVRVEFRYIKNGLTRKEKQLVHRLVAETFLGRSPEHTDVDHIDRDRQHNDVSNLRWTTHKQNMRNSSAFKHGKYATS